MAESTHESTFNDPEEFTEAELRQAESRVFLPDDAELADQMYGLNTVCSAKDEENNAGELSDVDSNNKSTTDGSNEPPNGGKKTGIFDPSVSSMRAKVAFGFLKRLVVIQDDVGVDGVSSTIGDEIELLMNTTYLSQGDWKIIRGTDEINDFFGEGKNVTEEILKEVHQRKYWTGTQIYTNATLNYYNFLTGNTESPGLALQHIYETGRDPVAMTPYVVTTLKNMTVDFQQKFWSNMSQEMVAKLSDEEKLAVIQSQAITTPPEFIYNDYRPFTNYTLIAPIQVGLIYLIILTFFQFNFFAQVHQILLPHIKIQHYLIYRTIGNHFSYLILSLFLCAVSAIFQIDFTLAFGRAGFVVFWLSTYLTMAAVGGANENMGILLFAHNPPLFNFWLMSFVILNVSPSFSPMALTSRFYRYGYIFPIHHSNEIFKVVFFDLWKGQLGMNYGVIAAWHSAMVMAKKTRAEAAAKAEEKKN
ncbi:Nitrosoguanidine resistance protein SNG1 [Cyberlindnera fabianii]|uniref:Nitrosoguanidine resistance protein SNG1 n=1 Tax=Cyberlindnera fabianii TaxID=36022 RepID=A0A1V2LEB2_CYBFA|nr:Nitrosoguanidine resistance protein SNG1 [Cyberlindnera fabianii]